MTNFGRMFSALISHFGIVIVKLSYIKGLFLSKFKRFPLAVLLSKKLLQRNWKNKSH